MSAEGTADMTAPDVEQPTKRVKLDASTSSRAVEGVINPELLNSDTRSRLAEDYRASQPYTHCVMKEVFEVDLLRQVREEIIHNINATYKETDLFKVFQTGDLGNLDLLDPETAAKLPALMRLKAALYSDEFRAFITAVTGCGDLTTKTDCSCNVYAHGGHLLCHDDVIGTRRVSWIIYLTDPDDLWKPEDGGALELYPLAGEDGQAANREEEQVQVHVPAVHPAVCHLPAWNTMAMFTVLPGRSFHSVAEVTTDEKPRMSISGWYHASTPPPGAQHASLQQLTAVRAAAAKLQAQAAQETGETKGQEAGGLDAEGLRAGEDALCSHTPYEGGPPTGDLTEDDISLLARYINLDYLNEANWPKVAAKFVEDGSIQLIKFLRRGLAEKVLAACLQEDASDKLGAKQLPQYSAGVRDGWEPIGPPHKQRYMRYGGGLAGAGAGSHMQGLMEGLLSSSAFAKLISKLTTLAMAARTGEVRRFRPGMDYTVAHYGILTQDPRLDVVLTFVDASDADKVEVWQAGEVGGFEAYLLADEDGDGAAAAEVYRQDADESGVINVSATPNSLNLVLRDQGLMRFVKYVSYAAPGSRWDIAMEFIPQDDSSSDEDNENCDEQAHA